MHGLAVVVDATTKAASHLDVVDDHDVHAGVAGQRPDCDVVRTLSAGGGARRTTRRRVVPGVRMMIW